MKSHMWNGNIPRKGNPFEKYVITHDQSLRNTAIKPSVSIYTRLTDFWDANIYNGDNPAVTTQKNIGLAEYANANYVSDFNLFDQNPTAAHYFQHPAESNTTKQNIHIKNPFIPEETVIRPYFVKVGGGETGYLLAGVGYLPV